MINLSTSKENQLESFIKMEKQSHAKDFINGTDLTTHKRDFKDKNIIYLSITNENNDLIGYIILALSSDINEVEFRRILIDQNERGVGQAAIIKMEEYCKKVLNSKKIWLDVYEINVIGKHIYEKLGYRKFKEEESNGKKLFFYHKNL